MDFSRASLRLAIVGLRTSRPSVSSSLKRFGTTPLRRAIAARSLAKFGSRSCAGETLIEIFRPGQAAMFSQARWKTKRPISWIAPVSSATGMKSAGEMRPNSGRVPAHQRLDETMREIARPHDRLIDDGERASRRSALQSGAEPLLVDRAGFET